MRMSEKKRKERIKDTKERIGQLNMFINQIEAKLAARVDEDVDSYELSSDLGKKRTTRSRIADFIKLKKEYQKEKNMLEYLLRDLEGKNPKRILVKF